MAFPLHGIDTTPNLGGTYQPQCFADAQSSTGSRSPDRPLPSLMSDATSFDIFDWHPAYQNCQRYFLDRAQHEGAVQAVAALINIHLPHQWSSKPVMGGNEPPTIGASHGMYTLPYPRASPVSPTRPATHTFISLVPYIRRLVVTGFDSEGVLHGFFGDDWRKGVGPIQECERRNYLFAAKSVGWAKVKYQYDMSPQETVPFLRPLQRVQLAEIESAEKMWSQWLAMEDWMVGPRAPNSMEDSSKGSQPRT